MKIFVTGSSGFVGGHLVKLLSSKKIDVIAHCRSEQKNDIDPNITWVVKNNLEDEKWLREVLLGVDVVIHAAAYAHQTRETNQSDKDLFRSVNVGLSSILFDMAVQGNISHFIFISSIGACTSFCGSLVDENILPNPSNDYGISKLDAELMLSDRSKKSNLPLTIIRPVLIYGPANPGNMKRLGGLISLGIPLPFKGIKNKRSYLYVGNMTDFIYNCIVNEKAKEQLFHLADNDILSTPDLVSLIADASGIKVRQFSCPIFILRMIGKFGDLMNKILGRSFGMDSYSINRLEGSLFISNLKARKLLNWTPPFSTKEGITETCGKNNLSISSISRFN